MVLSVALLGGLMVVGAAAPALAAPPASSNNFNPQDTLIGVDGIDNLVLTDKFDGVDTLAHLTTAATTDTTEVHWVVCPPGTPDPTGPPPDAVPPATCVEIGSDTSGQVPANAATGQPNLDEAYEFFWDIPNTFDQVTRDIFVYSCNGAPTANEPGGNCRIEIEPGVDIDDGQTGSTTTTAAEYLDYCVDFNGDLDCADAGETRVAFGHGTTIPNLQPGQWLVLRARSSDDGITTLTSCLDDAADATAGSLDDCSLSDSSGGSAAAAFKNYTFAYDDTAVPDSAELGFFLHNLVNDGSGYCDGFDCLLDAHYVVSTAREARNVVATFRDPDPAVTDQQNCADPDKAETNQLGEDEVVLFCVTDQFGQPFDTAVTFESTGPSSAGFDSTGDCTAQNHDAFPLNQDGVDEHCDGSTGPDGVAEALAVNPDDHDLGEPVIRGVQTITACVEGEPFPVVPPLVVPAGHGCADEPANLKDTVAKTWESHATQVRLVFGDKTANCITGPTFKENLVGDTDNLLACTYDSFGNPTSTTGTNDGFLEWSIDTGFDDDVDTQYAGPPPSETDADAEAVAVIEALNQGTDFPVVTLRSDTTGNFISDDSVQKNVRRVPRPGKTPSTISIRHRKNPHRFQGRVRSSDASCVSGRNVVLKRVKRGRDRTIGRDATNARGKYRIRHRKTRVAKRYYTKVRGTPTCGGARSRTLRKR